ncbi:MAG: hypothetical protein L5655_11735, partial [Thermosediminibacteraceae bacterium]|nr:hypothetical protein [Thermosediminibacteraceae bacterium]
ITEGINVVGSLAATRGDVVKMVNNALEVPMMVQKTWGQFPEYAEDETKTLLKTKLGVEVVEGTLISFDEEEMIAKIETKDGDKEYKVAEGVSFAGLEDATVKAWKLSGKLVWFEVKSTVVYDTVASVVYESNKVKEIKLFNLDKSYKVAENADLGKDIDKLINDVGDNKLDGLFYGRFVIADGKITKATIYNVANKPYMVEKVDTNKEVVTYRYADVTGRTLRLGNYDDYKVVKDGKEAELADLEKDDIFYTYTDGDVIYIFAVSKKVDGKLSKLVVGEKAMIAGEYYNINDPAYMSKDGGEEFTLTTDFSDLLGEDVTAYLGLKDTIVYIVGETEGEGETLYGILIRTWRSDEDYVRLMLLDGTIKTYVVADGFDVVDNEDYYDRAFVKFTVNDDGEVEFDDNAILVEDFTSSSSELKRLNVDKDATKVDGMFVTSDTKIIDVTNYKPTDRKVTSLTWDDIKNTDPIDGVIAVADDNLGVAKVILINDPDFVSAEDDVYVAIVLDSAKIGTNKYEITLDKGEGKENIVFSTVYNKGDIITFKLDKDGKGVVVAPTGTKETKYVIDINGSFIKLGTIADDGTITEDNKYYKVASDAVIYDFTGTKPVEAALADLSDVERDEANNEIAVRADKVTVYVENDIVKAIKIEALGTSDW